MKKFYYDLETTGTNPGQHSVHQISAIIEIGGVVKEKLNFKVAPHIKCKINVDAMTVCGVTEEQIRSYEPMGLVFSKLEATLSGYVDRFNKRDKFHLIGYNNRSFDDVFFRKWFQHNGSAFFGSYFWADSQDVLTLASRILAPMRAEMPSFKLKRVAETLGIQVDPDRLHDSSYDVELTRQCDKILTKYVTVWGSLDPSDELY